MYWESLKSTIGQEEFVLWNNNKKALILTFHPSTNSARVETAKEKRVFLIRKEGFLKNRTVIRNEYGVLTGQLHYENKEKYIEMDHEKFFYIIRSNPFPEIVIYKESKINPLIICGLNVGSTHFTKNKILPVHLETGLLISLSWYLMMPKVKEKPAIMAV